MSTRPGRSYPACNVCGKHPAPALCPMGCKLSCFSLVFLSALGMCCPLRGKFLPKFCERGSAPNPPATWAMAQEGVCMETSFDRVSRLDGCDFFTGEGCIKYLKTFDRKAVARELRHKRGVLFRVWARCCRRSKRSKCSGLLHNCLGLHAALHQIYCLEHEGLLEYKREQPGERLSFGAAERAVYAEKFCASWNVCKHSALQRVPSGALRCLQAVQRQYTVPLHVAGVRVRDVSTLEVLLNGILLSKRSQRLRDAGIQVRVVSKLFAMLISMVMGEESQHLQALVRLAVSRGSEMHLQSQEFTNS